MTPGQIIVLAAPVFLLLIAVEFAWGWKKKRNTYRLNDAINSLSLGMLSQTTQVVTRLLRVGVYAALYSTVSLVPIEQALAFWNTWYGWLLALLFYDLCYYWLHRAGHECALFWAAHAVHHQSQDFNLSTALRHSSSGALVALFYLPMALAGVPPLVFGAATLVHLLFQFWVHTQHVGKLGWFDRWFSSPSNHRVHHGVNDGYWQRNYGGILIVWDRLFGSYSAEGEPCVYGSRSPLNSWDPLWSNAAVYWALLKDSWYAGSWSDKLRVWFKSPGWRPADVAARFPTPRVDHRTLERYHPPVSRQVAWFGAVQFVLLGLGVALFLWHADSMPLSRSAVWLAALAAGLWSLGAAMQGRITIAEVLLIEAAALAAASAADNLVLAHRVLEPLALAIGMVVVVNARHAREDGLPHVMLLTALWFSLLGDSLQMFPGLAVAGQMASVAAHLFYVAVFKEGQAWFPSRRALWIALGTATAICAALFAGMPPALRIAVGAWAIVLALAAAQAIGRASVLRDSASTAVATGASLFMAGQALVAIDTFALPLPMSQFLAPAVYYAAQILIVAGMVRSARPAPVIPSRPPPTPTPSA